MLAVGIVLGFFLGGLSPRRELAERDQTIARLERELDEADRGGWRSPVPGLDRILRDPEERSRDTVAREGRGSTAEENAEDTPVLDDGGVPPIGWRERWRDRESTPEDRLEGFMRAVSVQRVRRVQSRAALAEQAALSDEELAEVDAALGEMNDELEGYGEELVLLVMSDVPPSPRELLGVTHDVTGVLQRAQLRLEEIVGPERAASVDESALEIWNHVDLGQLEPAVREAVERGR